MEELKAWVGLIAVLISIGVAIHSFMTSGSKANSGKIASLTKEKDELERRVQSLEDEVKHLPSKETAHQLQLGMEKMNGRLDTLDERLKPIGSISNRLQEFLLIQATK